jgi:DNA segregation ATPase FtsK/SpoIIIE, S-DNA-T family
MVEYIIAVAKSSGISALPGPWLPPLPETLEFNRMPRAMKVEGYRELLLAPIGLTDDPRGQRQEPLYIDFASDGNLFVYGAPGTGKTTLLKTLCLSLASRYTPEEVHMYLMDFGGTSLKVFEELPHCGGVMTLEQESKIQRFMLFLFRMIDDRKKLFEQSGHAGFVEYREDGHTLPAVVVMIDNYFALSETYETVDDRMYVLAREGFKYGIYLVATASNATLVRYKFSVNFKMALSLPLIEKGEYDGIVGRTEGLEPMKVAGRGLVRGKPPLEFQTALPEFEGMDTLQWIRAIRQRSIASAVPIPVMPSVIDIVKLNERDDRLSTRSPDWLAIGLGDQDLQPVYIDLTSTPVFMVAGEPMSGKSTLISSWIRMMKNAEVYALDSAGMGLYEIMDLSYVTDLSQSVDTHVERIQSILDERRQQLIDCKRAGGDAGSLVRSWSQIVIAIDRFSEFTNDGDYSLKELIERVMKRERGMKVAILTGDNTSEFAGNWDSLGKLLREEQTGILLGSIKEQMLYNAKLPYGTPEKEIEQGDGYLIIKNKYTGLRFAMLREKAVSMF